MKIMRNLLLMFLFTAVSLYAGIIEKTFYFDDYEIIKAGDYQIINFKNTRVIGKTGEPVLPYHAVSLLLPPGEIAEKIEITGSNEKIAPGSFQLYPRQYSRPLSKGASGEFVKNEEIYNSDTVYPASLTGKLTSAFMNGYSFALSCFTPVKYNPASGRLSFYSEVSVKIFTRSEMSMQKISNNLKSSDAVLKKVKCLAQNADEIASYPHIVSDSGGYQMLIITPTEFVDDFSPLGYLYLVRGIKLKVVTTDSIYNSMPAATYKESIRNFIIQEYQNHNIEYVLLGGDIEHIPYAPFYCTVQSSSVYESNDIPADLYYSALDGTWNDDGDEYWGEIGEEDLLPELAVGRLPFSDENELSKMLNKITNYQDNPVLNELDKPLLAGEHLWSAPLTWGGDYLDLLIGYHEDNGYTTEGIPEDHNIEKLYDRDLYPNEWDKNTLIAKINEGKSFVHHSGHANYYSVMKLSDSDITNENFANVDGTTHNFTLVYTHGCNCGGFDQSDCIAEQMVSIDNFAAAFVGNSRYGWFNEGQTEGPSLHIHREFVDALHSDKYFRIGWTHTESKTATAPWVTAPGQHEEGALRWCFYCCNVLGDPAMGVWTDEPVTIEADYPSTIDTGAISIQVTVTSDGSPAEGMTCVVMKDSILHGVGVTDSYGNTEIVLDPQITEEGEADLIISGYNCKPTYFSITVSGASSIETDVVLPTVTSLIGNYPNPFNPKTVISYKLSVVSNVNLSVYNSLGQKVETLISAKQAIGEHFVEWDASGYASGSYYCRMSTNNGFVKTKKMTVLK